MCNTSNTLIPLTPASSLPLQSNIPYSIHHKAYTGYACTENVARHFPPDIFLHIFIEVGVSGNAHSFSYETGTSWMVVGSTAHCPDPCAHVHNNSLSLIIFALNMKNARKSLKLKTIWAQISIFLSSFRLPLGNLHREGERGRERGKIYTKIDPKKKYAP